MEPFSCGPNLPRPPRQEVTRRPPIRSQRGWPCQKAVRSLCGSSFSALVWAGMMGLYARGVL